MQAKGFRYMVTGCKAGGTTIAVIITGVSMEENSEPDGGSEKKLMQNR